MYIVKLRLREIQYYGGDKGWRWVGTRLSEPIGLSMEGLGYHARQMNENVSREKDGSELSERQSWRTVSTRSLWDVVPEF